MAARPSTTVGAGFRPVPPRALKVFTAAVAVSAIVLVSGAEGLAASPSIRTIPGSAPRGIANARFVGDVPTEKQLEVSVTLQPRNADLLASLAARSSARRPLDPAQVQALFLPSEEDVAAVRAYLGGQGFRFREAAGLTLSFGGPVRAAEAAFGVDLGLYRDARGGSFRAPDGPPTLPARLVGKVAAVDGLDTAARYRPSQQLAPQAVTPSPTCGAPDFQNLNGGYLPADLAASGAYDYQSLHDAGFDGTGERIAFVEFSNYRSEDIDTFKDCFGLTTPYIDVDVAGGTLDRFGAGEVVLDVEIAMSAAPDLDAAYIYMAPNTTSMAVMLNKIVEDQAATGVHIISISWGLCEAFIPPSELAATNTALQLAAVSGISVFSASGDNGSSDCLPEQAGLAVDDPSAQPYATAVGGTNLDLSSGRSETTWNSAYGSGGGGLSSRWPMPSWQSGVVGADSSGDPCGATPNYCRHTPDVALNADPENGYIIYCRTEDCGFQGWLKVGGTSAAAPLLAAMTASANESSLANGGERLGFASPYFYDRFANGGGFFVDVTSGTNDLDALGKFAAGTGYDLATGLGALNGSLFAADLAGYTSSPAEIHTTALTATPGGSKTIKAGARVSFNGTLTDTTAGAPLSGKLVWVELSDALGIRAWTVPTDASGHWSMPLSAFRRKTTWRAFYLGEEELAGAATSGRLVYVIPKIVLSANVRFVAGHYVVRHGTVFSTKGTTKPNMAGAMVTLQWRIAGTSRWRTATSAQVGSGGGLTARGSWGLAGRYYMRWRYPGSQSKPWMTGASPAKLFVVT